MSPLGSGQQENPPDNSGEDQAENHHTTAIEVGSVSISLEENATKHRAW
jgi:hypothetical protein